MAKNPAPPDQSPAVLLFEAYLSEKTPRQKLTAFNAVLDWYSHHFTKLTPEETRIFSQVSFVLKNMFGITVSLEAPQNLPVELSKAKLKVSEIISQTDPLPDSFVPPTLDTLLADLAAHNAEIQKTLARQEGIPESDLSDFEKLVTRLGVISGTDETGQAIAFTSAVEIITEKKLSPKEISAVIGEKMVAAGQKPPPRSTIATVTPQIIAETQSLIAAVQTVAASRPGPTPPASEPTHPIISSGVTPKEEITQTMHALHTAKQKAAAPVYSPRESYQKELAGNIQGRQIFTKAPKHLRGKGTETTSKVLAQTVIRDYLTQASQGDTMNLGSLLKQGSEPRWRLEAEIRKSGLENLSDDQIDELIRAVAATSLPAALQHEGLFLTVNPSQETNPYAEYPGHPLWQIRKLGQWFRYQITEYGSDNLDKELQKAQQQLNTKLATKTAGVQQIESQLHTLETQLAKVPSTETHLSQLRAEIDRLRINLADAHRSFSETKIEQTTLETRREIWEKSLLLEDFDREIKAARDRGDYTLAKKLAQQKMLVFQATHRQIRNEADLPRAEIEKLLHQLQTHGLPESSSAILVARGLLNQNESPTIRVTAADLNQISQEMTARGLPSLKSFDDLQGIFNNRLPFYDHIIQYRARLSQSSSQLMLRLTGGRWSSVSHLLHGVYNRTLGPLTAALKNTRISQWLTGKAGLWAAKSLGFKAGLSGLTAATAALLGVPEPVFTKIAAAVLATARIVWGAAKSLLRKLKDHPEVLIGGGIVTALVVGLPAVGLVIAGAGVGMMLAGGIGTALGGLGAGITGFFTALTLAPIGAGVSLLVAGTLGGLAILTLLVVIITAAAFIVPIQPDQYTPPQQTYFTVSKTVDDTEIANDELPATVNYHLEVIAEQEIIITDITDNRELTCKGSEPFVPGMTLDLTPPPSEAGPRTTWSRDYDFRFPDNSFQDCRFCNTVKVIADLADGSASGLEASDSVCVKIGDPPEDCPDGWPTDYGLITQGPNTDSDPYERCSSHYQDEAIDIGVRVGTLVKATFRGEVSETGNSTLGGRYIIIEGNCNGSNFSAYYYHLNTILVQAGEEVTPGYVIATSGNTGTKTTGPHLHYEFVGLTMAEPYIPETVPQSCCAPGVCGAPCNFEHCGVSW